MIKWPNVINLLPGVAACSPWKWCHVGSLCWFPLLAGWTLSSNSGQVSLDGGVGHASLHSCHHVALLNSPLGNDRAGWERALMVPTGWVIFPLNY